MSAEQVHLDIVLAEPPGAVITSLMLRLSAEQGALAQPRMTLEGARLPLRRGPFGGRAELIVSAVESGTRVRLVGSRPPWPFSLGWAGRVESRYLRGIGITSAQ